MAGDTVRDAFRSELAAVKTSASITWDIKDTWNTTETPDAGSPFLTLEFAIGDEEQSSFGAPGSNLYLERAPVFVHLITPLGENRDTLETYALAVRTAFRNRSFAAGSNTIRIWGVAPMGGGELAGGMWAETVALAYRVYHRG